MVNPFKILAGGNIAFIASYLFDSTDRTLTLVTKNPSGKNPTWIVKSVVNPSVLYAVNHIAAGAIQSFTIFENGTLSNIVSSTSIGNKPAHALALPSGEVSVANFAGGTTAIVPTENLGTTFRDPTVITFPVGSSHPHQTIQFKEELFVPDVGGDRIWRLVRNSFGVFSIGGKINQPAGSGPRHAAIHDDILVTLHETSSTITSQRIPPLGQDSSDIISSLSIIPENQTKLEGAQFAAAEILIPSPNHAFPSTLIYASNRNVGTNFDPSGDSIAILTLSTDGKLEMVNQVFTGLRELRAMEFGGPGDRFLLASGEAGDGGVVVFERTEKGTNLVEIARNKEIPSLTSLVWL